MDKSSQQARSRLLSHPFFYTVKKDPALLSHYFRDNYTYLFHDHFYKQIIDLLMRHVLNSRSTAIPEDSITRARFEEYVGFRKGFFKQNMPETMMTYCSEKDALLSRHFEEASPSTLAGCIGIVLSCRLGWLDICDTLYRAEGSTKESKALYLSEDAHGKEKVFEFGRYLDQLPQRDSYAILEPSIAAFVRGLELEYDLYSHYCPSFTQERVTDASNDNRKEDRESFAFRVKTTHQKKVGESSDFMLR